MSFTIINKFVPETILFSILASTHYPVLNGGNQYPKIPPKNSLNQLQLENAIFSCKNSSENVGFIWMHSLTENYQSRVIKHRWGRWEWWGNINQLIEFYLRLGDLIDCRDWYIFVRDVAVCSRHSANWDLNTEILIHIFIFDI